MSSSAIAVEDPAEDEGGSRGRALMEELAAELAERLDGTPTVS